MKILFLGDIFGEPGVNSVIKNLPQLIKKHQVDFVIAQGENVTNRKGLAPADYRKLKAAGVSAFTMGNHVWAEASIEKIIKNKDVIRPFNVKDEYPGRGSQIFKVGIETLRVTSLLGIEYNKLRTGWKKDHADNFFDAFDKLHEAKPAADYHVIDFHAEVTSEKAVFALYADGKASAVLGTHTHVQTNDARRLPKGTVFITDIGMTGPMNAAIGADWNSVYKRMRYNERSIFTVSTNPVQINYVVLNLGKKSTIKAFNVIDK